MLSLSKGAPSTVNVGGVSVPLDTNWRTWIKIWKVVDSTKPEWLKAAAILILAYPNDGEKPTPYEQASLDPDAALLAAIRFLERREENEQKRPLTAFQKKLSGKRLLDWDWDAASVIADFEREYKIDLTSPDTTMHWWRFMSLFDGLSDTSKTMDVVRVRAADLDDRNLSAREKRYLRERKQALMLPARTKEEVAENRRLRGSDV